MSAPSPTRGAAARRPRSAAAAALALALASAVAGQGSAARPAALAPGVAAAAPGAELRFEELDPLLVDRFALSQDGRAILRHLVSTRLVEAIAAERGLSVSDAEVERRYAEIDAKAREAGEPEGLEGQIRANRLEPSFFRAMLRVAIAQERLTREALALPADAAPSGEQQQIWLDQQLAERGLETPPPPWEGPVARCGPVSVSLEDLCLALRRELSLEDVEEACYQLLLEKRLRVVLVGIAGGEIPNETWRAALARELERRRAEVAADPRYKGVSYDQILTARGMMPGTFERDPAVLCATLVALCTERRWDPAARRAVYEAERESFDGRYGEALRARLILHRAERPEDARADLERLAREIASEQDFAARAGRTNDDPGLKKGAGDLGWFTRQDPRLDADLRGQLFGALDAAPLPPGGRLAGPVAVPGGWALAWLAERRPGPEWELMDLFVERELRRRLVEEALPRASLRTYLDPP